MSRAEGLWVIRRRRCDDCGGAGMVTHPVWERYFELRPRRDPTEWARSMGFREPPPEEIPCGGCDGAGYVEDQVPLWQALRALGVPCCITSGAGDGKEVAS